MSLPRIQSKWHLVISLTNQLLESANSPIDLDQMNLYLPACFAVFPLLHRLILWLPKIIKKIKLLVCFESDLII